MSKEVPDPEVYVTAIDGMLCVMMNGHWLVLRDVKLSEEVPGHGKDTTEE